MAVYFTVSGRPHCSRCFFDLSGRDRSDLCPSCGAWYAIDRARVAPGRLRMMVLTLFDRAARREIAGAIPHLFETPALRWLSVVLLVLGNTLLVISIAGIAMRDQIGCEFGP
jgi:hypothetical protein